VIFLGAKITRLPGLSCGEIDNTVFFEGDLFGTEVLDLNKKLQWDKQKMCHETDISGSDSDNRKFLKKWYFLSV